MNGQRASILREAQGSQAPPFSCGTVAVRPEDLILFYGKDEEARFVLSLPAPLLLADVTAVHVSRILKSF